MGINNAWAYFLHFIYIYPYFLPELRECVSTITMYMIILYVILKITPRVTKIKIIKIHILSNSS